MANPYDYTGRTVDLFIFQDLKSSGEALIDIGFGEGPGQIITGIQKLVQKWTTLFLTDTGTKLYNPTEGTNFLTDVRLGNIRIESDLVASFNDAAFQIAEVLSQDPDIDQLQADEKLQEANLVDFNIDTASSTILLRVQIVSQAGSSREVKLPISVAIK